MEKKVMGNHVTPKVEWSLSDEGMGVLERAGLAGLYLTLTAADKWAGQGNQQAQKLRQTLQWELSDQAVRLWWDGEDRDVLTQLLKWAWQEKEGVFFLPAVHRSQDDQEHLYKRLDIHRGLLQTFFQHPKVLPREKQDVTEIIQEDENRVFPVKYRKIKPLEEGLPPTRILANLIDKGLMAENVSLSSSWIYPGGAKRFGKAAKEEENWSGPPKLGFLMLFTPLACVFLELPRTRGKKGGGRLQPNWAFLVPEIQSLTTFAKYFPFFGFHKPMDFLAVRVQSLGDAALRFASAYVAKSMERRLGPQIVYIVAMGQVSHYQGQKIRKRILELQPSPISTKRYVLLMKYLPNEFRTRQVNKGENPTQIQAELWIPQPTARGRIADNLVHGRPWYQELMWPHPWLLDKLENQRQQIKQREKENISLEHLWFRELLSERRALMNLAKEEAMWDKPEEEMALLTIFHQALRQLLNKEEEAQKRGGSRNLSERWDDRVEAIRRGLMRAKTRELNRKFLMEFLAEGGGSKELTEKKEALWRFLNHPYDWQKARDLAFLALVTFTDKRLGKPKEIAESEEAGSDE